MNVPSFITSSLHILPNWVEAFPGATHTVGLPKRFDKFDESLIFLDYMNLDAPNKAKWLAQCVLTRRKVFVLSPTPNEYEAIEVIKAGAVGYGHTLAASTRLREMALVANHGGLWVGNKLMKRVMTALGQPERSQKPQKRGIESFSSRLTEREFAVAKYIALGATNAEISSALDIKERTVKAHITSIFEKLEVRNRVGLALLLNDVDISEDSIGN